jgi:hypothetical protein
MKDFKTKMREMSVISLMTMGALPLFFASCSSSDDDPVKSENTELKEIRLNGSVLLSAASAWDTRAGETTPSTKALAADEKVFVVVNNYQANSEATYKNLYHQSMTASTGGALSGTNKMYFPASGNVDIYSYRNGGYNVTNTATPASQVSQGASISVSAQTDQTSTDNQTLSDFLFGQSLNVAATNSTIALTLEHLMTRVTVKVNVADDSFKNNYLTGISLKSVVTAGTYNVGTTIDTLAIAKTPAYNDVKLYASATDDGTALVKDIDLGTLTGIFVPQNMSGKKLEFTTKDGTTFAYTFDRKFEKGKSYNYTLNLTYTGIHVSTSITDWVDVNGLTGDAELQVTVQPTVSSGDTGK